MRFVAAKKFNIETIYSMESSNMMNCILPGFQNLYFVVKYRV